MGGIMINKCDTIIHHHSSTLGEHLTQKVQRAVSIQWIELLDSIFNHKINLSLALSIVASS